MPHAPKFHHLRGSFIPSSLSVVHGAHALGGCDRSVNVGYLSRVLRLLACEGIVTEKPRTEGHKTTGVYALTDVGKLLQVGKYFI